ncbi:aminopeptidase N-like [Nylanderia fulva]|uniref:aminopeptidase N-like n=1 Tax=Nylanderia fulva TaxID=613905 RepID=UPI0010FB69F4|nr:aminopeptidase N-like [Nylanderia fulva]
MTVRHSDLKDYMDIPTSYHYDLKISLIPGYVSHGESNIVIYLYRPIRFILFKRLQWQTLANLVHRRERNKKFIATLFQFTRRLPIFPYFYISELVTLNISVEHEKRYLVLSNRPIKSQSVSNDTMLTLFDKFPYTYINEVALILMSDMTPSNPITYDLISYSKITINMWSRSDLVPHMKFPQYVFENVIKYLDDNWNIMRRGPKIDCIVIPNFNGNIRQTWGLLLYNETYITYNEKLYPAYKATAMRLITHEIIYQWFNNFFYPWCNYWLLNEGFIKFIETYIIDKVFPNSGMMNLFIIQDQHEYRYMDIYFLLIFMEHLQITHFKLIHFLLINVFTVIGPIVWRMIESVIPNNAFWEIINTYLKTVAIYRNSRVPDHLCDIMQIIDASAIKNYKINIKQMINVWAKQKYCPVLNAIRDYNGAYVNISIDKKQPFNQTTFFIPITYTMEMNIDFNTKSSTIDHYLTESNPELKIPIINETQWVIIDKQQTGYYRVNYDPENWRRIARYLNSENYINIHVLNRAQIIDDAFHFAVEKKLNFSIFWDLASYLSRREKDYIAWYPMIKAFEYLSNYFAITSASDMNLFQYSRFFKNLHEHIYTSLYENIFHQINVKDKFNNYLKLELAKWGCLINYDLCVKIAKNKLELYVQKPTLNKILPEWQEWTYCNGLKTANRDMWTIIYNMSSNMYKEKSDYKRLIYLSCSENPDLIFNLLWNIIPAFETEMLKDNDHKMLAHENERKVYTLTTYMYLSTLARHAKNTPVLEAILNNYVYIKHSQISTEVILNVLINNAYSKEQLFDKIMKFVNTKMPLSDYKDDIEQKTIIKQKIITRSDKVFVQSRFFHNLFK